MIESVHLERFKNFRDAELKLGGLTLLVGTNASGKSNLREAFRFLHGISRGYTLAEILGEKWIEGGLLQWTGIRGGPREIVYRGGDTFRLGIRWTNSSAELLDYHIEVDAGTKGTPPQVVRESLYWAGKLVFDVRPMATPKSQRDMKYVSARLTDQKGKPVKFLANQPVLSQLATESPKFSDDNAKFLVAMNCILACSDIESMRFFELAPSSMRRPSIPGQDILGDRGENLSSVLQAMCEDAQTKRAALGWVCELTPLDVIDFDFVSDAAGRVLLTLVDSDGQRISAYSASDGTLRFLAFLAAFLGPAPERFYFIEELENGIHPTRLHLLSQLIEHAVTHRNIQVVATTHSPQLLGFLSEKARENAALVYRLDGQPDAHIRRIMDIPDAARVLKKQNLGRLHGMGWLEDAVACLEDEAVEA